MKRYMHRTILFLSALFILSACTEDMEFKNIKVTPVNKFYAPANSETVELVDDKHTTLFFDWEPAKAEDSGSPLYEVLFDKKGGDFSTPIYRKPSDANSASSFVKIAHTDLDYICSLAGIQPGETITLIWTVSATRGLNQVLAKETHELTVKRY